MTHACINSPNSYKHHQTPPTQLPRTQTQRGFRHVQLHQAAVARNGKRQGPAAGREQSVATEVQRGQCLGPEDGVAQTVKPGKFIKGTAGAGGFAGQVIEGEVQMHEAGGGQPQGVGNGGAFGRPQRTVAQGDTGEFGEITFVILNHPR